METQYSTPTDDPPVDSFTLAYAVALVGCIAGSALTFLYVPGPAREANPVTAAIIGRVGLGGMFVARTIALLAAFRVYAYVRGSTGWVAASTAFAWLAAAIQVADAVHDLRVAMVIGPPPEGALLGCVALAAGSAVAGVAFRP
jgi:hypothetical protein